MSNKTRRWLRGMIEAVIHGGTSSVISVLTANLLDKQDWGIVQNPSNFFKLLGATFAGNAILRLCQFLNNNPLPPEGDTVAVAKDGQVIVGPAQISLNPLSKVVPMPKEPETPKP